MAENLADPLQSDRQESNGNAVGLRPCQRPQTGPDHPGGWGGDGENGESGDLVRQCRPDFSERGPHHCRSSRQPPLASGLGSQAEPLRTGPKHSLLPGRSGAPQRHLPFAECEPGRRVYHLAQPGGGHSQSRGSVGLGGRRVLCASRNQHCAGDFPPSGFRRADPERQAGSFGKRAKQLLPKRILPLVGPRGKPQTAGANRGRTCGGRSIWIQLHRLLPGVSLRSYRAGKRHLSGGLVRILCGR